VIVASLASEILASEVGAGSAPRFGRTPMWRDVGDGFGHGGRIKVAVEAISRSTGDAAAIDTPDSPRPHRPLLMTSAGVRLRGSSALPRAWSGIRVETGTR
jgi:hypothetical protein